MADVHTVQTRYRTWPLAPRDRTIIPLVLPEGTQPPRVAPSRYRDTPGTRQSVHPLTPRRARRRLLVNVINDDECEVKKGKVRP